MVLRDPSRPCRSHSALQTEGSHKVLTPEGTVGQICVLRIGDDTREKRQDPAIAVGPFPPRMHVISPIVEVRGDVKEQGSVVQRSGQLRL